MDPSVVVAQEPPKSPRFKLPKISGMLVLSVIVLALAIAAVYYLPKLIPQFKQTKTNTFTTPNYSLDLNKTIKKTFSSSNRYQDVIQLNQLAYSEKDLNKKYKDYVSLFSKISQDYLQTKKVEFKAILYQLKDYIRAFPQYKEGDVVIPKWLKSFYY